MTEFRHQFKNLDDAVLIDTSEYGSLMGITGAAMSQRRHNGELAEPAIQGGKLLRWRAGDVREWLKQLNQDSRPGPLTSSKRTGRPRVRREAEKAAT